ncbi:3'-5' exonuclease [Pseudoalteromonas maricaloris]|uniref:3'-5' exonuclease n=1 Tax=Pseudoalteromonas maricaloris TaxID=184924 RepID=UPI00029A7785|nr:3'-5' exonuclease [Pseudoalteromonas flavipulchra]
MKNLMLDIETMGKGSNAAIVAIGACFFDVETGQIGEKFERLINLENSENMGDIDASTVLWWMKQSDEARAKLNSPDAICLRTALHEFREFVSQRVVKVWGNGASFDCVILKNAYAAIGVQEPWLFYNERDVRTLVDIGRQIAGVDPKKDLAFSGVQHSALDDAIHQAVYVSEIYKALRNTQI